MRQVELTHLKDVSARKAAAEPARKVLSKLFHQPFSVTRPLTSALLLFKDALADPPICSSHNGINRTARLFSRCLQPAGYIYQETAVFPRRESLLTPPNNFFNHRATRTSARSAWAEHPLTQ